MRTVDELLERADEILQKADDSRYAEHKSHLAAFAQAHTGLALAIITRDWEEQ